MPIDIRLKEKCIPPIMFIKALINGKDENYENYLLEMVNNSTSFKKLSDCSDYTKPLKEDKGECDCNSANYSLDFKLLASNSFCHQKRELSLQIFYNHGIYMHTGSRKEGQAKVSILHKILRSYDFYNPIYPEDLDEELFINDIEYYKKVLLKKKNLLFFYPFELFFEEENDSKEALTKKIEALENDFSNSFKYRNDKLPKFDTYLSFIDNNQFIILEFKNKHFYLFDRVDVDKCPTYKRMMSEYSI